MDCNAVRATLVDRCWSDRRRQPHPRLARGFLAVYPAVGVRCRRRWSGKFMGVTPLYTPSSD